MYGLWQGKRVHPRTSKFQSHTILLELKLCMLAWFIDAPNDVEKSSKSRQNKYALFEVDLSLKC